MRCLSSSTCWSLICSIVALLSQWLMSRVKYDSVAWSFESLEIDRLRPSRDWVIVNDDKVLVCRKFYKVARFKGLPNLVP